MHTQTNNRQSDNNIKSSNIHVIPIVVFRCQGRQFTQSQHPISTYKLQ